MPRCLILPLTTILTVVTVIAVIFTAMTVALPPAPIRVTAIATPIRSDNAKVAAVVTSLSRSEHTAIPADPVNLGIARLIFKPGRESPFWSLPGPLLLAVGSGALSASLRSPGQVQRRTGTRELGVGDVLLAPGDALILPTGSWASLRGVEAMPTVVLAAGVFPASGVGRADARLAPVVGRDWSPTADVLQLTAGTAVDLDAPLVRIELSRAVVDPGSALSLTATAALTFVVETGSLTLTPDRGEVVLPDPAARDERIVPGTEVTLLPGGSALLENMASATVRNDGSGPLNLLMLAVDPDPEG